MVDWTSLAILDHEQWVDSLSLKYQMEKIWRRPGVVYANNITGWYQSTSHLTTHLITRKGKRYPPVKSPWRRPASWGLTPMGLRILRFYYQRSKL